MARVYVIGLAGGIGSGKSAAAAAFEKLGAVVLDADAMVHELLRKPAILRKIVRRFGKDVLDRRGRVDRKKLGEEVFRSQQAIRDLEAMLHPEVMRQSKRRIAQRKRRKKPSVVIIDAPLPVSYTHLTLPTN